MRVVFEYTVRHKAELEIEADTFKEAMAIARPEDADWDILDDVSDAEITHVAILDKDD